MKLVLCILIIFVLSIPTITEIGPTPGSQLVRPVFEKSDVVCNCFVRSLSPANTQPSIVKGNCPGPARMSADIVVRDWYKTSQYSLASLVVEYDQDQACYSITQPTVWKGETALMFLKATPSATYAWADTFLAAIPFKSLPPQSGQLGPGKLQAALMFVANQQNREDQIRALRLLHGFDTLTPDSVSSILPLSDSKDPDVAFLALAVLLTTKTPESVERLVRYLDAYKGDRGPLALININTDLAQIRDVRALSHLELLCSSRFALIRDGAMRALRGIKSPHSVPVLVQRLDDSDSDIKYLAVITLAEILGKYEGDYAPSMYLFDKKPSFYTNLWKTWWANERHTP